MRRPWGSAVVWVATSCIAAPASRLPVAPSTDDRVDALVASMTLEEKAGQLTQYSAGRPTGPGTDRERLEDAVAAGRVGSLLNVVTAAQADAYQRIAVEQSRLRIPLLFGLDVIHGFRTIFPIPLGLSASWDPGLVEEVSRLAALESSGQGVRWTFSPMVDIARDARWGRIAEGAGEDPYLGSAFAAAYVRGYQGTDLGNPTSILACAKHFVGYGAAEGGRDYNTTEISERTLRQVYLPPFQAAARAGAGTFMAGFNALDGVPSSANPLTLRQVLRGEWRYPGLVVSDWSSVLETEAHGIANEGLTAARKAFLAGVDVDMESGLYASALPALVRSGVVPEARVDEAVRRLVRLKLALGLFERPYAPALRAAAGQPLPPESMAIAQRAAEESFVLLRNEAIDNGEPLLPLTPRPGKVIALIGPMADRAGEMLGSWSAQGRPSDVITLRSALLDRLAKEKMSLLYSSGIDAGGHAEANASATLARRADVIVLALGEEADLTGEAASRTTLDLPDPQQVLLRAVAATGKPIVLLLFNGRPLATRWAAENVPALLEAWYPGVAAGPALVRTLFGESNPSGRLTATVPRAVGQEPLYYNALNTGRPASDPIDLARLPVTERERYVSRYLDELNAPLYPFGYGLSYSTFAYSRVTASASRVSAAALNAGQAQLRVSADVTNSSTRTGTEIVQLYIRLTGTSVARPVRELKGFRRLELGPGQTAPVEFSLGQAELSFWNLEMKETVEPARLTVWVAHDSVSGIPVQVELTQ